MSVRALWNFVAGGSRVTPVATAIAVATTVLLLRAGVSAGIVGATLAVVVALGLIAAVFERG